MTRKINFLAMPQDSKRKKKLLSIHKKSFQLSLAFSVCQWLGTDHIKHNYNSYFYEIRIKKKSIASSIISQTQ